MFGKKTTETLIPDSQIFAIYDSKTESYGEPIFGLNGPDMIRRISNSFLKKEQQEQNPHFLNAEDFSLFQIGSYDKSSGKIYGKENPTHVVNFHELRSMVERKILSQMVRENPHGSTRGQANGVDTALLPT